MPAKKFRTSTLGNLNRLLAEIFSAPKAKIEQAKAQTPKRVSPKRKS